VRKIDAKEGTLMEGRAAGENEQQRKDTAFYLSIPHSPFPISFVRSEERQLI